MRSNQATSYKLIKRPIYGSSRVGIDTRQGVADNTELELFGYTAPTSGILTHELGLKQYEFSNHLGNVLTTVSDKKIPVDVGNDGTIDWYVADITSATDYYPFGSPMDGRTFSSDKYRFGFNGKENDNEVKGAGSQQDYGMRIYDTRICKFLSVDPLTKDFPWYTPYQFAGNKPIWAIDLDGAEEYYTSKGELIGKYGTSTEIRVVFDVYVKAAQDMIAQQSIAPNPTTDMTNCMLYNKGSSGAYKSTDEAAFEWASKYNQQSIDMNKEMGSDIFVVKINGKSFCAFEQPVIGGEYSVADPIRDFTVAHIHSHAAYVEGVKSNEFSKDIWYYVNGSVWEMDVKGDINNYDDLNINGYVTTPNGSLLKYSFGDVKRIGGMYAFDKNDPETPDLGTDTPDIYEEKTEINSTNDEYE